MSLIDPLVRVGLGICESAPVEKAGKFGRKVWNSRIVSTLAGNQCLQSGAQRVGEAACSSSCVRSGGEAVGRSVMRAADERYGDEDIGLTEGDKQDIADFLDGLDYSGR